ncbi:MAG: hypothetical protein CMN72_06815 [Sphingomonas sp.]|nr:hypothetical protein [Sphingomonas sp.]
MADQESLGDALRALCAICARCEPPERAALSEIRWRFARGLMRHLPLKDRIVYSRLRLHPDPAVVAVAERYSAEAHQMYEAFLAYSERWTPEAVEADWAGYCAHMRLMTHGLEERVAREKAELLPHLATAPAVPAERRDGDRNWAADGWRMRELLGIDRPSDESEAA